MADRPTRILILGGGFGGVYTALTLEKLLKREIRDRRVELGLISRDNYIVFQPMLPEVISGSIGILDTITPIRRLCPSTNLYTRTVDKIDLDRKRVSAAAAFRNVKPAEIRVILLHAQALILPELPKSLAEFAQRLLMKRGVELRLNTRLHGATADAALLVGGERIPTRTLVSTVPSAPNPLVAELQVKKEKGRIVVDRHLQLPDHPDVWAVGDCAWVVDAKSGEPCPPTAQHATRQAKRAAENIAAAIRGGAKRDFSFKALGKMGSLGHHSAVAEVFGMKLSGFLAWWLWRTIYLMKLPGLDRKIRVATDWTLDLILPPDITQLKTEHPEGIRRAHFEPDEIIFREGDRGDVLYVLVDGEVEVTKRVPGQGDVVLRRLRPGECFGEIALVSDQARSATVRSLTGVNVLAVDRDAFQALFSNLPPLRGFFEQLIEARLGGPGDPMA